MHRDSKTTKKSIDSLSTLRRTLISLPVCSSLAAILATGFVTPVAAKQGAAPLEEFVVTARKREEGIQDVPIAITAITGEELQQANISDMTRLAAIVPNFHHAEAVPSSDQFIIRGLGTTGVNIGFEQAVGMVFNGFFLGNSRFGRTAFLDVQRVEVLKGPQGALIGKNNSVGAVSIVSRRPGDELEGYLLGSYETEAGEGYGLEGAVSIPFSENARGRFAFRQEDVDGWTENTATGTPEQTRDDLTLRAILDIEISERVGLEFLFQYGDLQRNGRNREPWNCANNATSANPSDPGEDCLLNYTRQVQRIVMGEPVDEPHSTEYSLLDVSRSGRCPTVRH